MCVLESDWLLVEGLIGVVDWLLVEAEEVEVEEVEVGKCLIMTSFDVLGNGNRILGAED